MADIEIHFLLRIDEKKLNLSYAFLRTAIRLMSIGVPIKHYKTHTCKPKTSTIGDKNKSHQ